MIGLFEVGCGAVAIWALFETAAARKDRRALERTKMMYQDAMAIHAEAVATYKYEANEKPAFQPGDTELCGGCGHMLPPESIKACPGKSCSMYKESLTQADVQDNFIEKVPIGYKGFLHRDQK